jgi:uncharacterized protein (DUF58 family)
VLTRHGNRIGAMLYTDRVETVLTPRSGRRHVLHLMHAIARCTATPPRSPEGTRLGDLLAAAQSALTRRAMVFVVSDFVSAPGWQRPLAALAQRHDVVAVRLYDPLEMALPDIGLMVIEDAETGEQVFVDTHDRGFRRRFAAIAERRERELRAARAAAGVDALELATVDDLADALMRFAELRKRRVQALSGKPLPAHLRAASCSSSGRNGCGSPRSCRCSSRCTCGCCAAARSARCDTRASRSSTRRSARRVGCAATYRRR